MSNQKEAREKVNGSGATTPSEIGLEKAHELALTLAQGAAGLTYAPEEVRVSVRAAPPDSLPFAAVSAANEAASQDTALFVEHLEAAQKVQPPSMSAETYDVVAPIGKGGMGEVWKAVQRSLGREVALKQLATDNPAALTHFISEARITARLSHANIIPVHSLGRAGDGRPMLAMKLVNGRTWLEILNEGRDLGKNLQILLSVCNAIAFAHDEGFLHRDIKPANVMVAEYGQVFVLDWGIAVGLDAAACDSQGILYVRDVRSPAGTPAYMAPELAVGDGERQGPRTDVYLLGACLFEVICGAAPHSGEDTRAALMHAVSSPEPTFVDDAPKELQDICRRALKKDPSERYADVASFKAAIERFLAHDAARAIIAKGKGAGARLVDQIDAFANAAADQKAEIARGLHRSYTEARFAFETALESWPDAEEAKTGAYEVTKTMLEHALVTEDVALATRLASDLSDPESKAKAEALREKTEARSAELSALREQAKMLDDSRVARPIGGVFVVAGLAGGVATFPTRTFLDRDASHSAIPIAMVWGTITLLCGLYAYVVLRRAKKSLVSPRVGFTWAGVGLACVLAGVISAAQGETPFQNASYTTVMIGIGFVAMALQTRLWLLYPAALTFTAAVSMGFFQNYRVEIFGGLWFVALTGVGLFLRRRGEQAADS